MMETKLKWKFFYWVFFISVMLLLMGIWNDNNKWLMWAGLIIFLVNFILAYFLIPEEKKEVENVD